MSIPKELMEQIEREANAYCGEVTIKGTNVTISAKECYVAGANRLAYKIAKLEEMLKVAEEALEEIDRGRKMLDSKFKKWTKSEIAEEALTKLKEMREGTNERKP